MCGRKIRCQLVNVDIVDVLFRDLRPTKGKTCKYSQPMLATDFEDGVVDI